MDKNQFKEFLEIVGFMFNHSYSNEAGAWVWEQVKDCPDEALHTVMKNLERDGNLYPPKPKEIVAKVKEIATLQREAQARRDKREYEQGTAEAVSETGKRIAKCTSALLTAYLSGKLTRGAYLDKLRELNGIFPNIGFDRSGMMTEKHFEKHGLDKDGTPAFPMADLS